MNFEVQSEEVSFTPEQEEEMRQIAVERARKDLAAFEADISDEEAFVHLPRAAIAAFHLEQFDEAGKLAERALLLAPSFQRNWNYGNAVHLGHTVLGLLALRQKDEVLATEELRRAGDTPGSPQLNSFGPTMQLAKELLKCGHSDAVLAYLQQCRKFWKMGETWLGLWERKIRAGLVPNCFQHSYG
jgi:tetratricopeptide (TPR) repeat protein